MRAVAYWPKPRQRTIALAADSSDAKNVLVSFIESVQDALNPAKADPVKGLPRDLSSGSVQVQPEEGSQKVERKNQGNGSAKTGGEGARDSKDVDSKSDNEEPDSSPPVIVATQKSIFEVCTFPLSILECHGPCIYFFAPVQHVSTKYPRHNLQLDKEEWNACATSAGDVNPFLLHEFFGALESSGSAAPQRGWVPCHITIREGSSQDASENGSTKTSTENSATQPSGGDGASEQPESKQEEMDRLRAASGRLLGVVPAYMKSHSYGEYVFDHSWANLYAQVLNSLSYICQHNKNGCIRTKCDATWANIS